MADHKQTVFKVWVTQYALTAGIELREVEDCFDVSGDMVQDLSRALFYHGEGKNWHRTRESAVKRANTMREAKIKSLEKSIAKLKKMEF